MTEISVCVLRRNTEMNFVRASAMAGIPREQFTRSILVASSPTRPTHTYIHTYIKSTYIAHNSKESTCAGISRQFVEPNKCVFKFCLNTENVRSGRRSLGGRSFHNRELAAMKLPSPNRLCARGTHTTFGRHWSLSAVVDGRHLTVGDSRRGARYAGAAPASDW